VLETKALIGNTVTMLITPAGQSDKIDHQNIAPGGDFKGQLGKTGL
jgi:hypothetical protein